MKLKLPERFASPSPKVMLSLSLAIGTGMLLLDGIGLTHRAIASQASAPVIRPTLSQKILQIAQTDPTSSDDVIVDTEPDTADPTTPDDPATNPDNQSGSQTATRFACQINQGQYTVMYSPESQPDQAYPWAVPSAMGGGWSPQARCNEISRRLESYRPDGLLEMQTGVENGYNTICVTTQRVPSCRIVLTVPVGQDPRSTRDRVFENLTVADSGQQTQGVNALTGDDRDGLLDQVGNVLNVDLSSLKRNSARRSDAINLRPFLDRADGGTATRLQGGATTRTNSQLNPDRFR